MTEITLVRHGQASFGSDNYDQLSPLGHRQSRWLGEYFVERSQQFDRIIMGAQQRHRETTEGIVSAFAQHPDFEIHHGLNEYDFHAVYEAFSRQYPDQLQTGYDDRRHFYTILRRGLNAWSQGRLTGPELESWQQFSSRVTEAVNFASRDKEKVLVVSSGGAIAMILGQALELQAESIISLNLQTINASFSKILVTPKRQHLLSYNNIPHLETVERLSDITYS